MKARRLWITPALWIESLKSETPMAFRVSKNALPGDAKCIGMESTNIRGTVGMVVLWIESAAFRDDDPDDLPEPVLTAVEAK